MIALIFLDFENQNISNSSSNLGSLGLLDKQNVTERLKILIGSCHMECYQIIRKGVRLLLSPA